MSASNRVVVLGAGHAGGSVAALLRHFGHTGEIVVFGEELIPPYQRPPLSKAYLKGETDAESLKLKADEFYGDNAITLRLGARAKSIDVARKIVVMDGSETVGYDILIIATGSRARKLSIAGASYLKGVHELRGVADAEGLKGALEHGKRLAVIGGGYVGLEAAASARALGADVVVIEREARVLARVACEPLSLFFQNYHRARGVEILTSAQVESFDEGVDGHISAVRLVGGGRVECDAALVGVGAIACDELARTAGLACENGVVVDLSARTSNPDIYAIGDVTWRPMPIYGGRMSRLESVPNALEQAKQAASAIVGRPAPAPEVPWFWSDQYDIKLQIAGIPFDVDDLLIRGSIDRAKFSIFHLKGDRILAVEAVNSPHEFLAGRQLVGLARAIDRHRLRDSAVSMKNVAA
jgi:3-phenylpropionate/trans-cinnamate dioxygenase ferredoxin reductase subunit